MDNLYQWLYDKYALPQLQALENGQDDILKTFSERLRLSKSERRRLLDMMENIRLQWGTEIFALGVRFGLAFAAPRTPDEDCEWLTNFLPQLNDPVA